MIAQVLVLQGAAWGSHRQAPFFAYRVPPALAATLQPGHLVLVPFGAQLVNGIVWEVAPSRRSTGTLPPGSLPIAMERGRQALERDRQDQGDQPRTPVPPAPSADRNVCAPSDESGRAPFTLPSPSAGVSWLPSPSADGEQGSRGATGGLGVGPSLREIRALVDPVPVVDATRRALAEWLAGQYVCGLVEAVRLCAPGMTGRQRLDLVGAATDDLHVPLAAATDGPEARALLGLLANGGRADEATIRHALGSRRGAALIAALEARGALARVMHATIPRAAAPEMMLRLVAAPDDLAAWRAEMLAAFITPTPAPVRRTRRPAVTSRGARSRGALLQRIATADGTASLAPPSAPVGARDLVRRRAAVAVADLLAATPGGVRPQREVLRLTRATPAALRLLTEPGLAIAEEAVPDAPAALAGATPLALTDEQTAAVGHIVAALDAATELQAQAFDAALADAVALPAPDDVILAELAAAARPILLHGITGSGKTEVYLQALAAAIARGRRGIVLVPEIALTPQTVARFAARFPGRVALVHSALRPAERQHEGQRIRSGAVDVVIGSRSAIFAPLPDLGLIILDEEHDGSYKEDARPPTYHARAVACELARLTGSAVVLGSATPATESYHHAQTGEYALVELQERPMIQGVAPTLPPVEIVDLRAELHAGHTSILSRALLAELAATLARGEQAILFLNRRGSATCVLCRDCGNVLRCGRCDVPLTHHQGIAKLICHYCDWRETPPTHCFRCGSAEIRFFGIGTERVETTVRKLFPRARVLRWDADTVRGYRDHERFARALADREVDLLIGTQMIAKGLDVPGVTLVGIIAADVALYLPDYRAPERAFQVLTQVAGRAGRGARPGKVLLQTFSPEHAVIEAAAHHDYRAFYDVEIATRRVYGYPPFRRFAKLTYTHADRHACQVEAISLGDHLMRLIADLGVPETDLVGPAPAFIERLRERYRWQMILRGPDPRAVLAAMAPGEIGPGWAIDIDPTSSL
jgi:primosomal protein N' (replication factor Y)